MITPQKFIAELQMLRTRAKELGLPITANMIGRAIEVCEVERDGDLLTVRRIEELEVGTHHRAGSTASRERAEMTRGEAVCDREGRREYVGGDTRSEDWAR